MVVSSSDPPEGPTPAHPLARGNLSLAEGFRGWEGFGEWCVHGQLRFDLEK